MNVTVYIYLGKMPWDAFVLLFSLFLNPAKKEHMQKIVDEKMGIAKGFFINVDMHTLYPELFRILWFSTLPCVEGGDQGQGAHAALL